MIECEQPDRKLRRGTGKSDPIDAHLAVLAALRLDADRLPTPRADGDREALRILLSARHELTTTTTGQSNRLRALLLGGDDTERQIARGTLTEVTLASLARNRAIHTIAINRMRSCPKTRAYVARRTAEGKTMREIRRCLKRYITRQLYRILTTAMNPTAEAPQDLHPEIT